MKDWQKILVRNTAPIIDAIGIIDKGGLQIALVVDENNRLLGTVTDGDIRRALLKQIQLSSPISEAMCTNFVSAREHEDVLALMRQRDIMQIPLVDKNGVITGLKSLKEVVSTPGLENPVVLMAGGLGTRLRPLTDTCPKPMLAVGGKPILETILGNFIAHGFRNFILCVNYKSEIIKGYFGDGSRWGARITYVEEHKRMGTAGALSLLPERPTMPFFVMNGDLLTNTNFRQLLEFHKAGGGKATMCVREYEFQVPFGVVTTNGNALVSIEEKPKHNFFVNAGIYVLNPEALDVIPEDTFYDMPDLYRTLMTQNHSATCFPIREYWLDIGRMDDFERAETEYDSHFCSIQNG